MRWPLPDAPRSFVKFPLIPGIDLAGTVEASSYPGIAVGDRVVANSWGLSQTHHGGYAQKARVKGEWLVKIPAPFSTKDAMAIGTAGYTAMLSVLALEHGGITPQRGDILVTGANGGVGSIAIALLADLGYRVVASTGRLEEADYLRSLGAADVIDRRTLSEPGAPIARERWAGAVELGRQSYAGERAGADAVPRRGNGLRPGSGCRSSRNGSAVHPAECHPCGHRLGECPAGGANSKHGRVWLATWT